jgi:uncharacterized protein DUF222
VPANAVTERTSTMYDRYGSPVERAGSADSFALDPPGFVALTWLRERGPGQIPCAAHEPPDGTDAKEADERQPLGELVGRIADERQPLDELVGRIVEDLPPGPTLANWLASVTPGSQDAFALPGMADAWRRLAAWATAGELATIAEMTARAATRDGSVGVGPDGRPDRISEAAVAEVGLALRMSRFGAEIWADLAVTLNWRLPRTLAALSQGAIDLSRARLIAEATSVLDEADVAAVEDKVLANAGRLTLGQLRAVLRRAVISVDPAAAERRRQQAERQASVGLYGDSEGTATLAGHKLPGGQAVAAMARVTALAQAMKAAGAGGGIDLLRAQVFIGLLLNTLPFIPPPQEDPGAPGPPQPTDDGPGGGSCDSGPGDESPGSDGPRDEQHPPANKGHAPAGGSHTSSQEPAGHRATTDLGTAAGRGTIRYQGAAADRETKAEPGTGTNQETTAERRPPAGRDTAAERGQAADQKTAAERGRAADWETAAERGRTAGHDTAAERGTAPDRESEAGPGTAAVSASPWPGLPGHDDVPSSGCPPGQPGRVTLTVPWQTLVGMSAEPGTVCWLGPVTPQVSRQIAEAGADDPRTEWRVIVTSSSGEFICVARIRRPRRSRADPTDATDGESCAPRRSVGLIDRVTVTVPAELLDSGPQLAISVQGEDTTHKEAARRGTALGDVAQRDVRHEDAAREDAAREGFRDWAEIGPGTLARMLKAALITARRAHARAVAGPAHLADSSGTCSHADHEPQYRPSTRLRATILARDQTCRFPGCRQPAWDSDLDHSIPYHLGGPTCSCNLGPACRRHHQVKQENGWQLEQPAPGFFIWITPSGRRYDVTPEAYPT